MNPEIQIIARGDAVSTERKLVHAGANKVVLPTHIGAERIAEILLFPETSRFIRESERMRELERQLRNLGLVIEVVVAPEGGALTDLTIEEIESRTNSAFFVVQINRRDGDVFTSPPPETVVGEGDGVVLIGRPNRAAILTSLFEPRQRVSARG